VPQQSQRLDGTPLPRVKSPGSVDALLDTGTQPEGAHRAALALAEAIIPGSAHIPAADEATVRQAALLLAQLSPTVARAWSTAQRTLDAAARLRTGRPFHALSCAQQEGLLTKWGRDPVLKLPLALVSLFYKAVHFDRQDVQRAMGARAKPPLPVSEPRWTAQVHAAATWTGGDVECDVVVVGTGAGGGVVGYELAERGHAVVFVEEGQLYHRHSFDGSSVRALARFYRPAFSVGNVVVPIFSGRMVGGSTAINGGTSFRTPPWVLDRWCEELGTDEFLAKALEPYFQRVEAHLEVGPSSRRHVGPIADVFQRGCDALGWKHGYLLRNAPGCESSGFCDFGCRTDARRSTNVAYLPPALERGSLLFTGFKAEQLLQKDGRAVGIEGVAVNGQHIRIHAKAVILAGGSISTPLFLLRQKLGNSSGQVGRNLTLHPSCCVSALFEEEIRGFDYIPQGYASQEFLREGLLLLAAQPSQNVAAGLFPATGRRLMEPLAQLPHLATLGPLIADATRNGRVWRELKGLPAIHYTLTPADVQRLQRGLVLCMEMAAAAGARHFYPGVLSHPSLDTKRGLDRFRKARLSAADLAVASYHPLGTCEMGADARTSVVGFDHQSHDVPGLFVVDGSTVRGPLGVNPQLTIMALATRAAEQISPHLG
jgi:choline dehydrogenase-like flavoprotein